MRNRQSASYWRASEYSPDLKLVDDFDLTLNILIELV